MNRKKKVLFFTPSTVGGAERVTLTIAKMLLQDEYEVKIVYICDNIGDLRNFVPTRIHTEHIKVKSIWDFVTLRMFCFIKREKPFAVFSSLHYLNPRTIISAYMVGVKRIIVRNNIGWSMWGVSCKFLARLTFGKATTIVSQSEEMKSEFIKAFPQLIKKMEAIPNPIDIATITEKMEYSVSPYQQGKINYVYSGRISPEKGLEILVEAFAKVKEKICNASLTIVGDNTKNVKYYNQLRTIIAKKHLENDVSFVGFQENPYQYVSFADCFVLPSRKEGNPNVLHEAMYLQVPVVATRSVPVVEQCVTANRGYVVDIDDADGMANAMLKALDIRNIPSYLYGEEKRFINLFK